MSGAGLSRWPEALSRPTVRAWRDAAVRGDDLDQRLRLATEAYVAAGGTKAGAQEEVEGIIRAAAREHGDWLLGPDMRRIDATAPLDYPPPRGWPEPYPGNPLRLRRDQKPRM